MSSLSLFVKLTAAAFFGVIAVISHRNLRREQALFFQRRDILRRIATVSISSSRPPIILIAGFRAHGKSSFVNTACRVLSGEDGPLVFRTQTAPQATPPGSPTTRTDRVVRLVAGWWWDEREEEEEGMEEEVVLEMVDTPGISPMAVGNVRQEVEETLSWWKKPSSSSVVEAAEVDCVVVVVRCPGVDAKRRISALRKVGEIAGIVREHELDIVVVLTHKEAMKSARQAEELRKEAAAMARTDCVYIIDNYTSESGRPFSPANNFETHFNVLAIIRQCMEYTLIHRTQPKQQQRQTEQQKEKGTANNSKTSLTSKSPILLPN